MRAFWSGTISFGMVNIPVSIFPATKRNELAFHFLHEEDMGRIRNERVCEECGKKIPYDELVRGYEVEKDKHISLAKEDFEKVELEAAKNISILDFVEASEIDPMFFDKPYYIVPEKNGEKAYVLLREALERTKKVGIAKVVFHTREHLAAVNPRGAALMLDVMHFADEIKSSKEMSLPSESVAVGKKELEMAEKLIESMVDKFKPEKYQDTYRENLLKVIEAKQHGSAVRTKASRKQPTNVIDIMSKLKASLEKTSPRKKAGSRSEKLKKTG